MRTYLLFALFVTAVLSSAAALRAAAGEPCAPAKPVATDAIVQQAPLDQRQVLVKAEVIEVSRTKMRTLGIDFARIDGAAEEGENSTAAVPTSMAALIASSPDDPAATRHVRKFFDALLKNQLAKVLSSSEIVVTTGKPASIRVGPEIPMRVPQPQGESTVEMIHAGTRIHCTARLLDDGTIHLDYRHAVRSSSAEYSPERGLPRYLRTTEFDTSFDLKSGQMGAVSQTEKRIEVTQHATERREKENEIEVLLLVTAELVEKSAD
ncbi:MAG: hypothetical protein KF708_00970 [Pirellulales bacterium]|nr:hypothetical protein [Pirellulales bacterium]